MKNSRAGVQLKKGCGIMKNPIAKGLPIVSVVIPTLNRKQHLKACLNSLFDMDYPKSVLEVIVVDGDSFDGTKEMVKTDFQEVRLLIDRRQGISFARNTGAEVASGEIIAFTDDDCVVDREWLRSLVKAFSDERIGAAGGPTIPLRPDSLAPQLVESGMLGLFSLGDQPCEVRWPDVLVTANLAVRHEVFERLKFNVLFGRRNTLVYRWEEDVEFCNRLEGSGYKLMYIPAAKVYHDIDAKRSALKYLIAKQFSGGLSHYLVERKRKGKIPTAIHSFRLLLGATILFYRSRSITSFFWLIKQSGMALGTIFLP
jgi:GT2 family glycosyltransferase